MQTKKKYTQSELNALVKKHEKWLKHETGGAKLCLRECDLNNLHVDNAKLKKAVFEDCDMVYVRFEECDLTNAVFSYSKLGDATFSDCNLTEAEIDCANCKDALFDHCNLTEASFFSSKCYAATWSKCDLIRTNLTETDCRQADFSDCNFDDITTDEDTVGYYLNCPEKGEFTAFKKAELYGGSERVIVELKVPASALRSSASSRKCRVSKAKVVSITSLDGKKHYKCNAYSMHSSSFVYKIGDIVEVKNFDKNRWNECAPGIHCFITRQEAVNY